MPITSRELNLKYRWGYRSQWFYSPSHQSFDGNLVISHLLTGLTHPLSVGRPDHYELDSSFYLEFPFFVFGSSPFLNSSYVQPCSVPKNLLVQVHSRSRYSRYRRRAANHSLYFVVRRFAKYIVRFLSLESSSSLFLWNWNRACSSI